MWRIILRLRCGVTLEPPLEIRSVMRVFCMLVDQVVVELVLVGKVDIRAERGIRLL